MSLFWRFVWPRSWRSLSGWVPLLIVGVIAAIGLSLALGLRSGVLRQSATATLRDGSQALPPAVGLAPGPWRASSRIATGYGPLNVTVFAGEAGQPLGLPGLPVIEEDDTVLASPAVLARRSDDRTGEIAVWLGDRQAAPLPEAALAHPDELVIIEYVETVPHGFESNFFPVRSHQGFPPDTSFVILGIAMLVLPSAAVALAGARVHLIGRAERYRLLRILGATPRQLRSVIVTDMIIPLLAGGLIGIAAYSATMSRIGAFRLAGSSYWARDLILPISTAACIVPVVALAGLTTSAAIVRRASHDPYRAPKRRRRGTGWVPALGVLGAPALIVLAAGEELPGSAWLITAGLLAGVVGLVGLARIVVSIAGWALLHHSRAQVAGSRMSRSAADTLLGGIAGSVAVMLVVFVLNANFYGSTPDVGDFDAVVAVDAPLGQPPPSPTSNVGDSEAPVFVDRTLPEQLASEVTELVGVTRVVPVHRYGVTLDGQETRLYTTSCHDIAGSAELDSPCVDGNVYLAAPTDQVAVSVFDRSSPAIESYSGSGPVDGTYPLDGTYPVGGQVTASWIESDSAVLIDDNPPPASSSLLLVTTDGTKESLRRVMDLRHHPSVGWMTTRAALSTDITSDTLVANPYLLVMAIVTALMAVSALGYAILAVFRQRVIEFSMLRSLGATRQLLAVDLGLLFAGPLSIAVGLSIGVGLMLARTYNTAFEVTANPSGQVGSLVAAWLVATGVATTLVMIRAARVKPLLADPDAIKG